MATHIIHPTNRVGPDELDDYLERGWRPTGQSIYTSDYLRTDDDELHGCLQIRLPLTDFRFKKRHRKLLSRNNRRFRYSCERAGLPDGELLRVNRLYHALHPEKTREDLEYNVITDAGQFILNTHLFRVYDGDTLVAFSYFDLGNDMIYSKAGIYDPAYASHSLGVYTMILEIDFALRQGVSYYHPGYFSPTFPAFDYKLQFGAMEYREISSGRWRPLSEDPESRPADPLTINRKKLREAQLGLQAAGIPSVLREYPSFTGRFRPSPSGENHMLDAPLILLVARPLSRERYLTLTYDNAGRDYRFDLVRPAHLFDVRVQVVSRRGVPRFTTPVIVERRIAVTDSWRELIDPIRQSARPFADL
jgi:arginine-tRNA-protein transferase